MLTHCCYLFFSLVDVTLTSRFFLFSFFSAPPIHSFIRSDRIRCCCCCCCMYIFFFFINSATHVLKVSWLKRLLAFDWDLITIFQRKWTYFFFLYAFEISNKTPTPEQPNRMPKNKRQKKSERIGFVDVDHWLKCLQNFYQFCNVFVGVWWPTSINPHIIYTSCMRHRQFLGKF